MLTRACHSTRYVNDRWIMAKKKTHQPWKVGDVFLVKTNDGLSVVAQIVGREAHFFNSVSCAFFDLHIKDESELKGFAQLPFEKIFSIQFVTRDLLDNGVWHIVSNLPVSVPREKLPYE